MARPTPRSSSSGIVLLAAVKRQRSIVLLWTGAILWLISVFVQYAAVPPLFDNNNNNNNIIHNNRNHYNEARSSLGYLLSSAIVDSNVTVHSHHRQQDVQNTTTVQGNNNHGKNMLETDNGATFNGIPLTYHKGIPESMFYCIDPTVDTRPPPTTKGSFVDSTMNEPLWIHRSCKFFNLCFDTRQEDYVVFLPWTTTTTPTTNSSSRGGKIQQRQMQMMQGGMMNRTLYAMALGGYNPRWDLRKGDEFGGWKVKWFPRVVDKTSSPSSSPIHAPRSSQFDGVFPDGYYQLPSDHVLLPFHSFAGHNVGHLIWDDFYPIFSLLRNFGLLSFDQQQQQPDHRRSKQSSRTLVPIRQVLPYKLYANCDIRKNKRQQCATNFHKFLPLLGVNPQHFSTSKTFQLHARNLSDHAIRTTTRTTTTTTKGSANGGGVGIRDVNDDSHTSLLKSPLVCASTAVAGMGMLTDHGWQDHGWNDERNKNNNNNNNCNQKNNNIIPHNLGRGANFFEFSNFLMQNIQSPAAAVEEEVPSAPHQQRQQQEHQQEQPSPPTRRKLPFVPPIRITWNLLSSRDQERRLDFAIPIQYLQSHLSPLKMFQQQPYEFWQLNMTQQIQIVSQETHIFITVCGGGSMTGVTFLPRGATLIVYYDPKGGGLNFTTLQTLDPQPARLDWDLLNNAGHLRVHWLPIPTMNHPDDLNLFHQLILHETQIIMREMEL